MTQTAQTNTDYVGRQQVKDLPQHLSPQAKTKRYNLSSVADPDLAIVCQYIVDSHLSLQEIEDRCQKLGRKVSAQTMDYWLYGKTMQPRNITISMVALALGYTRVWTKKSN